MSDTISLFTWHISLWPNCGFLKRDTEKRKPPLGHNEMCHVDRLNDPVVSGYESATT